ncbi:hypothetical protein [uncultured Tissierella sp.]|uniref:hypothetical protein n=1 Tax=uncultured Tissierella sp. TaxID=448160 RepID=UPI0028039D74|nr:hypothetical protein [uncultured Tissierella sp.]MDU5081219.1 hypothetical protein [Bacillota bacterium]
MEDTKMSNYDSAFIKKMAYYAINTYYDELNIKPIDVEVEFTDDLYKRRLELAINEKDIADVEKGKSFISGLNGTLVLPATLNEKPYILISNSTIDDSMLFISTLIHELTHIHDFYDFAKYHNIEHLSQMEEVNDFRDLYFWTEFHARRKGYYFYRKIIKGFIQDSKTKEEEAQYIMDIECPHHFKNLKEELINNQNNPIQFLYSIMQFLGRYSVWQDLFPDEFNTETLPRELINAFEHRIIDMCNFLYNHSNFENIKDKFPELRLKLDSFVIWES